MTTSTNPSPRSLLKRATPLVSLLAFAASLWVLQHSMQGLRMADVTAALGSLPVRTIFTAIALTAMSYTAATGYDFLAMRDMGQRVPAGTVAATAFTANALGNSLGNALVTGSAVRVWRYTAAGLSLAQIARLIALCSVSFWLGVLAAGVMVLQVSDLRWPAQIAWARWPFAAACMVLLAAYASLVAAGRLYGPLGWGKSKLRMPRPFIAAGQVAIGASDLLLLSTAFWALLPQQVTIADAACVMLVGVLAGNASFVPAGLGVFESVVLLMLGAHVPVTTLAVTLLAWRIIYFLLPLAVAAALLLLNPAMYPGRNRRR